MDKLVSLLAGSKIVAIAEDAGSIGLTITILKARKRYVVRLHAAGEALVARLLVPRKVVTTETREEELS